MQDTDLYQKILGLTPPWVVSKVELRITESRVNLKVEHEPAWRFACPRCGLPSPTHDHRNRKWRHLDTCGLVTMIDADIPRVHCPEHGILQAAVPWAEAGSGFTALFEALAISWLTVASISNVSERLGISWDEASGIMERAVRRGLERRTAAPIRELAIDETSFQKRHEYVTVLVDRTKGTVIDVLDDRKKATLKKWLQDNKKLLRKVRTVTMDMWEAFITAVQEEIDDANEKICFDRFHIAAHFGKAVDNIRAIEHRILSKQGDSPLKRTKHDWLRSKANGGYRDKKSFLRLTRMHLKTARAWQIKEVAQGLWNYVYRGVAERNWRALLAWISRCRLEPMVKVGKMVRTFLWGILNAVVNKATNASAESINAIIQRIKARACGYRNRARFRIAILFHKGGLSMLPAGV